MPTDDRSKPAASLLRTDDPAPFAVLNERGRAQALVVCDHASRAIPRALNGLGLPELATWQHVAWDIGAGELARGVASYLDAPAVLAGYSRLVVDCNRSPGGPEAFCERSGDWDIPGNIGIDAAARRVRLACCFDPYHDAVAAMLADLRRRGPPPLLISIHTFTPALQERTRPWHVGVLWDQDAATAQRVLAGLRAIDDLVVGDNEPYSGKHPAGYTIDQHAEPARLPHVSLEVRQDQFESAAGTERWVRLLGRVLRDLLPESDGLVAGGAR